MQSNEILYEIWHSDTLPAGLHMQQRLAPPAATTCCTYLLRSRQYRRNNRLIITSFSLRVVRMQRTKWFLFKFQIFITLTLFIRADLFNRLRAGRKTDFIAHHIITWCDISTQNALKIVQLHLDVILCYCRQVRNTFSRLVPVVAMHRLLNRTQVSLRFAKSMLNESLLHRRLVDSLSFSLFATLFKQSVHSRVMEEIIQQLRPNQKRSS